MKKIKLTPIFFTITFSPVANSYSQDKNEEIEAKGIAVLELFTSEGCSSCPPADELMGKIQKEYGSKEVYVLAYHVDYWDHQGWKDIFSNADYTKRQYGYANLFRSHSVYTPQVVINGKEEYIGSQENSIRNAIKGQLAEPATAQLSLNAQLADNKLEVNYTVGGTSNNSCLLLAIVQKSAQSNVKRGENAHRVLSHFQIVRRLDGILLTEERGGHATLGLPKGFNEENFEIIGFVQDMNSGAVLGATKFVF